MGFLAVETSPKNDKAEREKVLPMQYKFSIPKEKIKGKWKVFMAFQIKMFIVTFKIPLISIYIASFLPFLSLFDPACKRRNEG